MAVTPAKLGEVLKSVLVKEITGDSISKTAPIILAERITDFLSLLIISLVGAIVFDYGGNITVIVVIFFVVLIVIVSNKQLALPLINISEKIPFIKKYIHNIHSAYECSYQLLKLKPLILMTLLSLVSWGFECLDYYLILINFNAILAYSGHPSAIVFLQLLVQFQCCPEVWV